MAREKEINERTVLKFFNTVDPNQRVYTNEIAIAFGCKHPFKLVGGWRRHNMDEWSANLKKITKICDEYVKAGKLKKNKEKKKFQLACWNPSFPFGKDFFDYYQSIYYTKV